MENLLKVLNDLYEKEGWIIQSETGGGLWVHRNRNEKYEDATVWFNGSTKKYEVMS